MSTQAIWINKTSKGFTVWAQSMPSYSIPNNQGLDAAINYFNSKKDEWGADNWDNGIGTFLGTIDGDRDRILCEIGKTVEQVIEARSQPSNEAEEEQLDPDLTWGANYWNTEVRIQYPI